MGICTLYATICAKLMPQSYNNEYSFSKECIVHSNPMLFRFFSLHVEENERSSRLFTIHIIVDNRLLCY